MMASREAAHNNTFVVVDRVISLVNVARYGTILKGNVTSSKNMVNVDQSINQSRCGVGRWAGESFLRTYTSVPPTMTVELLHRAHDDLQNFQKVSSEG